jgi:predicted dehydrogenase
VYEQPEVREVNALKIELESFVDAVRGSREPLVTGEDGMRALRVAHDIIEIIKRGKIVIS